MTENWAQILKNLETAKRVLDPDAVPPPTPSVYASRDSKVQSRRAIRRHWGSATRSVIDAYRARVWRCAILRDMCFTFRQIAQDVGMAVSTVKYHLDRIRAGKCVWGNPYSFQSDTTEPLSTTTQGCKKEGSLIEGPSDGIEQGSAICGFGMGFAGAGDNFGIPGWFPDG